MHTMKALSRAQANIKTQTFQNYKMCVKDTIFWLLDIKNFCLQKQGELRSFFSGMEEQLSMNKLTVRNSTPHDSILFIT